MVFRNESPHRRGRAVGAGPSRQWHGGERGGHRANPCLLLHGQEKKVHADAGYLGVEKREEIAVGHANVEWYVAAKRGKVKAMADGLVKELTLRLEKAKAQARARGASLSCPQEPLPAPQGTLSRSGQEHRPVLHSLFALVNLFIARRSLLGTAGA